MDPKHVKQTLKEVRDAIKNGNNSLAIDKCQELLKADPKNYMGLILLGAAYQNTDQKQAAFHLRKAVSCSTTPTLALQGLANCAPKDELPEIYEQLLDHVPEKSCEYYDKISSLSLATPKVAQKCVQILKKAALAAETTDTKRSSHINLAKIWVTQDEVDDNDINLFKSCLEVAINESDNNDPSIQLKIFQRYLKLLYKQNDLEKLLKMSDHMFNFFPEELCPLEWICMVYCENYKTNSSILSALEMPIDFYVEKLENLNPKSSLAVLIRAIKAYEFEQMVQARSLLFQVNQIQPGYKVALQLMANTEMQIGAYIIAIPIVQSLGWTKEYGICLSHSSCPDDLKKAIEVLEKLDHSEEDVLDSLARCYQRLGEEEKLQELQLPPFLEIKYKLSPIEGLEKLQTFEDQECYKVLLLKAQLNIMVQNYDSALICMLKAARLRPYRAECFENLGKIYMALKDQTRAIKCFEKCTCLDTLNQTAVNMLSSIYLESGEAFYEKNLTLLLTALSKCPTGLLKWVHFKLGMHYLTVKDFDGAINSFRDSIKFDISVIVSWECLGDAYKERGSYNSSLRVFQKILELDPGNIYAKLQVALINMIIRNYAEAIEKFDELLTDHPDYLPGLKGAAESHIGLANNLKLEKRLGRSKYHLQQAVKYLERAFIICKQDMVWLWRLTANTFVQVALLPTSKAHLEVSAKLAKQGADGIIVLERKQLLSLATRFYTCALKLTQNTFLWYELSMCAYYSANYEPNDEVKHLDLAIKACKTAISHQSDRWENWNALGVFNAHKAINDLPFAQHCFIQALMIDRKSYTTWTNLGVLYLKLGDIKLANQAFQRAQQSSPIYPNAWIGQAMIAEHIADEEEALDLFRHCQQFEYHLESTIGYAHWVCSILCDPEKRKEPRFKRTIDLMFAGTVALDAITWYFAVEEDNCSPEALSYLGFLNAHHQLYRPAIRGYLQAVKTANPDARNKLYTDLGYMFLKNNQPKEAIDAFNSVTEASFKPIVGLALAYFRAGQHQEAYSVYNSILKSVAGSEEDKAAMILVAMASMVYSSQGEADTKTILYQCILLKDSPIEALYSACALGILHHDNQLTETILWELKKYERSLEHCAHIAFLTSQYHLKNNQTRKGLTYLIARVHMYPQCAELRKVLANYLLENYGQMRKYFLAISQMALSAIALGHGSSKKSSCIEDANSLMTASKALKAVDKKHSIKLIQRAIHLYPQNKDAWNALAVSVKG
ncbi:tetratricopeptide repeat protein 37 [Episyrphus balteatus]|uniref:tetratricopeptide repeat protein 37 n=1 Tax=Episyrphus balteatus TaxID=286459 RepID=UPI002484E29B|nr:tetratricopeptide repeat protein 37 [Episyrphus balteatus]